MKPKILKLTELSKKELSKRQMKKVKAGQEALNWCSEKCGSQSPDRAVANGEWYDYFYGPFPN